MSVYLKLMKVRNDLNKCDMKKTGKNQKFNYFELSDFLPKITELCNEHGICPIIKFGKNVAILKVIDVTKPESTVTFTSPIAEAKLPGNSQPVQNLGATQTYMRRYLYMNAFEISESDAVDGSDNDKVDKKPKQEPKPPVKKQEAKPEPEPKPNFQKKLGDLLVEMYGVENASAELKILTTFINEKKETIPGKDKLEDLSDAQAQTNYGKLKLIKEAKVRLEIYDKKHEGIKVELGYDASTGEVTETHGVEGSTEEQSASSMGIGCIRSGRG